MFLLDVLVLLKGVSVQKPIVAIAGGTGDLGGRVIRELLSMEASIRALVRRSSPADKKQKLATFGVEVVEVDFTDHPGLVSALKGADVVVSTMAGLHDTIVVAQTQLLMAAVEAEVPRFIPSDFALDFTKVPPESNRNISFRQEFRKVADQSKIRVTSVLNGAFTDMLTGLAPFVLFKQKRILCWGSPDQLMDFTTIDNTARFTAYVALDTDTPRFLKIAGDVISASGLSQVMQDLTGKRHKILKPGGLGLFSVMIRMAKFFVPGQDELYPPWQGMQYMHNMYSGIAKLDRLDNNRYPMHWTTVKDVLRAHLNKNP